MGNHSRPGGSGQAGGDGGKAGETACFQAEDWYSWLRIVNRVASLSLALAAGLACSGATQAQPSFGERFFAHNSAAAAIEPAWPTPVVEADPRLTQYYRFAFSNEYTPSGTQTVNYGNARGGGIIAWNRAEFDVLPPPYIQHNSTATDGFGDTSVLVKLRLASGNAELTDRMREAEDCCR